MVIPRLMFLFHFFSFSPLFLNPIQP
jgi:hypothetical protein